jgi:hypothetical protein
MLNTIDRFDFDLAESLGKTLGEVRSLPNSEVVQWRAFYRYRQAMSELHSG